MTYDEAMKRVESIVQELEQADALSLDFYKAKAKEVEELLRFCESQVGILEQDLIQKS